MCGFWQKTRRSGGGGKRRTLKHFNDKINIKEKQQALRTTAAHKTQTTVQAWSSLVFHRRRTSFYTSGAPPWDSRPVSGAGVVHYH